MVFFSGTDWSELEDNAPNHNFYLSLIVNNFMDFCAKVCFVVESADTKKFDFTAKDEYGNKYTYSSEDYVVDKRKLVVYDCDIISPPNEITIPDNFKQQVDKIIKDADSRPTRTYGVGTSLHNTSINSQPSYYGRDWNSRVNPPEKKQNTWDARNYSAPIFDDEEDELFEDAVEEFTIFMLNTGNDTSDFTSITDVIKNYKQYNLSGRALAKGILDEYVAIYENFFDQLEDKDDPKTFMEITEQVIENLEDERDSSTLQYMDDMLNPIIGGLRSMLKSFNNLEKVK